MTRTEEEYKAEIRKWQDKTMELSQKIINMSHNLVEAYSTIQILCQRIQELEGKEDA